MTNPTYITGDITQPVGDDVKIIAHIVNNVGAFGAGVSGAIGKRWPEVEQEYRSSWQWCPLGSVQTVHPITDKSVIIANLSAQDGLPGRSNPQPCSLDALQSCLQICRDYAMEWSASVHMPRIGTGYGGRSWNADILPIIERFLCAAGVQVYVYDLPEAA